MTTNPELSRRGLLQAAGVAGLGSLLTGRTPAQAERPDAKTLAGQPALGTIVEPSRHVPVVADCDVCVVGGNVDAARTSDALSQLQQVASALSLPDARIEPSEHA